MEYILFLTYKCNFNCSYCFAKNLVHNNISVTPEEIDNICNYIEQDIKINNRQDSSIVFFGGEPTLVPEIISDIIEKTTHLNLKYSIYTNGVLINELPEKLLTKLQTILVAIDGNREIHEKYKPVGSYDKILNNILEIRNKTTAQIVARITLEEDSNIYTSVNNLLNTFDFVHWQIVNKPIFNNPQKFISSYKEDLQKLYNKWLSSIEDGIILNIIPFNRIALSLLTEEKHISFRCGCGSSIQAIDIKGNIYTCDEYIDSPENSIGKISDNNYNLIKYIEHTDLFSDCITCKYSNICLGRCRKALETQSSDNIRIYCELTKILISMILDSIDRIKIAIQTHNIDLKKLHCEIYNTEILP